jgi:predicted Zn-dependent peptidase
VPDVLKICRDELHQVAEHGLTDEELSRAIGQLSGSTVLGLEDTGALMNRIGKSELCWGDQLSVDDLLARIAAVTPDEVREVARDVLGRRPSLAVIGPLKQKQAARLHEAVA